MSCCFLRGIFHLRQWPQLLFLWWILCFGRLVACVLLVFCMSQGNIYWPSSRWFQAMTHSFLILLLCPMFLLLCILHMRGGILWVAPCLATHMRYLLCVPVLVNLIGLYLRFGWLPWVLMALSTILTSCTSTLWGWLPGKLWVVSLPNHQTLIPLLALIRWRILRLKICSRLVVTFVTSWAPCPLFLQVLVPYGEI